MVFSGKTDKDALIDRGIRKDGVNWEQTVIRPDSSEADKDVPNRIQKAADLREVGRVEGVLEAYKKLPLSARGTQPDAPKATNTAPNKTLYARVSHVLTGVSGRKGRSTR